MSWNKDAFAHIYNDRDENKINYWDWLSRESEDESNWDDWLWHLELMCYDDFGAPKSMTELAQYKLLTLLDLLKIQPAGKIIDRVGWY